MIASSAAGSDDEASPIKVPAKKAAKTEKNTKLKRPVKLKAGKERGDDDKKPRRPSLHSIATSEVPSNGPQDDTDLPSDMSTCKYCKASFLQSALKPHMETCLIAHKKEAALKKKEKLKLKKSAATINDDDDKSTPAKTAKPKKPKATTEDGGESKGNGNGSDEDAEGDEVNESVILPPAVAKKTAKMKKMAGKKTEIGEGEKKGKKRKAAEEIEMKAPKKVKKKEEVKVKVVKPKGPVDVERQCGVITPNGVPCARSLTCKSHSMGAKRAVPGRSQPYDHLLAAYQKKNQAKQQKAAMDANAPLEDSDDPAAGPIDSDEEVGAVMTALATWAPVPFLPQPVHVSVQRRYQIERLREQLDHASSGGRRNVFRPKREGEVVGNGQDGNAEGVGGGGGGPSVGVVA